MSDIEELISAFEAGRLLRPSPDVPNIVDLSRALVSLADGDGVSPSPNSPALAKMIGPAEHLVCVLVDGLGMNLVERMNGGAFLRAHLAAELRTVFPSATAVALTSFATGEWPNTHGVTGWWTHIPQIEAAATIIQFVKRADKRPLGELGVKARQAFPVPSIMRCIERDTLALLPAGIARSVYSAYFCGGKTRLGYRSFREAIDFTVERVKAARKPTYTYLYTDRIDKEAHQSGVARPEIRGLLLDLDREVERLASALAGCARIVLSADHGFLDADEGFRRQIRMSDSLMRALKYPPSGDARVLYLHTREENEERVRGYFKMRFGDRFFVVSAQDAEKAALFGPGPISPEARRRIGSLVAISRGADVVEYRGAGGAGRVINEASQHSGLSPDEMRIPLVIV